MARREVVVTTTKTFCDQCHEPVPQRGKRVADVQAITIQTTTGEEFDLDFCDDACRTNWKEEHQIRASEVLNVRHENHLALA